ncbi:hypothetical protein OAN61_00150 [bacterium]|nr:hypothetical protein [bacterium]
MLRPIFIYAHVTSQLSVEELFKLADVNFNGALDHREVVAVEIMIADAIDGTLKFESNPHKANQLRKGTQAAF